MDVHFVFLLNGDTSFTLDKYFFASFKAAFDHDPVDK